MAFKKLVIASGQVSGASHSDFPVLIQPSKMTGWEALTLAEAESIRIYTDEAKTNEVAREVVDDSPDEIWVKVPTLTSSTELYVDYDGVRADYAVGATYGRNAVWGDYEFVSHDGGGTDSTGNHSPTAGGGVTAGGVTGKIGDATTFDGIDDHFDLGDSVLFDEQTSFQIWIKSPSASDIQIAVQTEDTFDRRFTVFLRQDFDPKIVQGFYRDQGSNADYRLNTGSSDIFDDTWRSVAMTVDGDNGAYRYIDGSLNESVPVEDGETWGGFTPNVGTYIGASIEFDRRYYNGDYDEVRIKSAALSPNWITTEYNNQNDVASFWGTVTDAGGDPPEPVADTGFFAFM